MFKRRRKRRDALRDADGAYFKAQNNLAMFYTINQATNGYIYIKLQHDRCKEIIDVYFWDAVTTKSVKNIDADTEIILAINELWTNIYNYAVDVKMIDAEILSRQ